MDYVRSTLIFKENNYIKGIFILQMNSITVLGFILRGPFDDDEIESRLTHSNDFLRKSASIFIFIQSLSRAN